MFPSAIYKKLGNKIKVDIVETNLNHLLVNPFSDFKTREIHIIESKQFDSFSEAENWVNSFLRFKEVKRLKENISVNGTVIRI